MPPTATLEDIKAYQEKVEKNQITPHSLPSCSSCSVDSAFFKVHAYRERRFLIIVKMLIKAVLSTLVRFKCPGCGKTFTYYPDFALPHKHYTQPTILGFAGAYVESEEKTYEQAVMVDLSVPGYPESEKTLASSTLHRWITTLSRLGITAQKALDLVLQENPSCSVFRNLAQLSIPHRKYRSPARKERLLSCRRLLLTEAFFQAVFQSSIFTKLAISCAFS
jgi:hypothetical protein